MQSPVFVFYQILGLLRVITRQGSCCLLLLWKKLIEDKYFPCLLPKLISGVIQTALLSEAEWSAHEFKIPAS